MTHTGDVDVMIIVMKKNYSGPRTAQFTIYVYDDSEKRSLFRV